MGCRARQRRLLPKDRGRKSMFAHGGIVAALLDPDSNDARLGIAPCSRVPNRRPGRRDGLNSEALSRDLDKARHAVRLEDQDHDDQAAEDDDLDMLGEVHGKVDAQDRVQVGEEDRQDGDERGTDYGSRDRP